MQQKRSNTEHFLLNSEIFNAFIYNIQYLNLKI